MSIYKVIAGAVPTVHDRKVNIAKGELVKPSHVVKHDDTNGRYVEMDDLIDESFFKDGEVGDLTRGKFIEVYTPEEATGDDTTSTTKSKKG